MQGYHEELERIQRDFARQRQEMVDLQGKLSAVTGKASSPDQAVSVVVGSGGEITELKFNGDKHRGMPGTELAALVLKTAAKARASLHEQLAGLMPSTPFDGIEFQDMVKPDFDWSTLLPGALPDLPDLPSGRRPGTQGPGR